jgi:P-type E1-E2 ATPase
VFFLKALEDLMLKILLVCAVISIVFDMSFSDPGHRNTAWIEGTAIFLAVFIVSFVGSFNDYKKDE